MTSQEQVRVTEDDEFRANDFWEDTSGLMDATFTELKVLLAKHRQAAEAEAKAREAELVEALHLAASRFQVASVDAIRAGETRLSADCIAWANDCTRAALTKEPDA